MQSHTKTDAVKVIYR